MNKKWPKLPLYFEKVNMLLYYILRRQKSFNIEIKSQAQLLASRNISGMKDKSIVIGEFNELVNMNPDELAEWLKEDASISSGWTKDGTGETVGHQSGRHIVDILRSNPTRAPDQYRDEDIDHMRKVVSYCKRHLAQEEQAKKNTDSKSYKSLKNWGHDALKE